MPRIKQEHCVTDTTMLLYDIAVALEKILAAIEKTAPASAQERVESMQTETAPTAQGVPATVPAPAARRGRKPAANQEDKE